MNTKKILISLLAALLFGAQLALAANEPENVTGLTATAVDDESIGLTWSAAKDSTGGEVDHYRIYYGTTSIFTTGTGEYDSYADTTSATESHVVTGLTASTTYYFAVTAFDSSDVESESYSDTEASATTLAASTTDTTSPTVTSVSAPDKTHVKVVFSEAVALPSATPEASFTIEEQINSSNTLTVESAAMDTTDTKNKTVLLVTTEQTASVNYIVTVGVAIKDTAGNPMVSGSTDSGLFLGSSAEEDTTETETTETTTATAKDCEDDMTCFLPYMDDCSLAMVTMADSEGKYEYGLEITEADGTDCVVQYAANKHPNILYDDTDMECKVPMGAYEETADYEEVFDTENCTGNLVDGYKAIVITAAAADTTPPEDVTNLVLSIKEQLEKVVVMLSWTASVNTAKDLVDQILYQSTDKGTTYDAGTSLGASVATTDVKDLEAGKEYTFKVTTKDASGNESTGVVKSIRLPQTGMGLGLVLLGSIYAARKALRRRKEDNEL